MNYFFTDWKGVTDWSSPDAWKQQQQDQEVLESQLHRLGQVLNAIATINLAFWPGEKDEILVYLSQELHDAGDAITHYIWFLEGVVPFVEKEEILDDLGYEVESYEYELHARVLHRLSKKLSAFAVIVSEKAGTDRIMIAVARDLDETAKMVARQKSFVRRLPMLIKEATQ